VILLVVDSMLLVPEDGCGARPILALLAILAITVSFERERWNKRLQKWNTTPS